MKSLTTELQVQVSYQKFFCFQLSYLGHIDPRVLEELQSLGHPTFLLFLINSVIMAFIIF